MSAFRLPTRFVNNHAKPPCATVSAYYPGPGRMPVGMPIAITRPWKRGLSGAQRDHVETLYQTCRAALSLNPSPAMVDKWYGSLPLSPQRALAVTHFTDLTDNEQLMLFHAGVGPHRQLFDYLVLA